MAEKFATIFFKARVFHTKESEKVAAENKSVPQSLLKMCIF